MVTELRIYFEGDPRLKPGFDEFFRVIKDSPVVSGVVSS